MTPASRAGAAGRDVVLHALHLCSGYAGFELGLRLAGLDCRTVGHVERDAYAAAVLVARMEDQTLDPAPIWSDLNTFDPDPWVGRVDIVTAGLPCQPFSGAGQQRGLDDGRHLWPMAERVIRRVGPRFVLLENVPDVVLPKYRWLEHVLCSLASFGFDAEWGVLSAADVGAPHERERFWLLGYSDVDGLEGVGERFGEDRSGGGLGRHPDRPDLPDAVAHPNGSGQQRRAWCERYSPELGERGAALALRWPPRRDDPNGWAEWAASGEPEPSLRRSTHGRPQGLADALHTGGNGLVPSVAAHAFVELAHRAGLGGL